MTLIGTAFIYGCEQALRDLPIVNLPPDTLKVRRRLRNVGFARAIVKTPRGVTCHLLTEAKGGLALAPAQFVQGSNTTDAQPGDRNVAAPCP